MECGGLMLTCVRGDRDVPSRSCEADVEAMAIERIWYPWTEWECYRAGFFTPTGSLDQLKEWRRQYVELLSDVKAFEKAMVRVVEEWPRSCAHNLTNEGMNRIAWLGQSSACITFGACAEQTRSAFNLLSQKKQDQANAAAAKHLDEWLRLLRLFGQVAA